MIPSKSISLSMGLSLCIFAGTVDGVMAVSTAHTVQVRDLVARVQRDMASRPMPSFPNTPIAGNLEMIPAFQTLVPVVASNWPSILDNWNEAAPDRPARIVLMHAFLFLQPDDYLQCVRRLLQMTKQGRIQKDEFVYTVLISPTDKRWFLSYNHENPEVARLLDDIRDTFLDEPHIPELVRFIKEGKAKKRDEVLRQQTPSLGKRPLPLLSSQSKGDTSEPAQSRRGGVAITAIVVIAVLCALAALLFRNKR